MVSPQNQQKDALHAEHGAVAVNYPCMSLHRFMRSTLLGITVLLMAAVPLMTGCGNFFIPLCQAYNTTCPTTTTTTTTTPAASVKAPAGLSANSFVYVAHTATGSIHAFSIGASQLTSVAKPVSTPGNSQPSAVAASPNGNLLYVATSNGAIYAYTITSDGSLQVSHGGAAVASTSQPTWMSMDRSGNWLFVASSSASRVQEFHVDAAQGTLQPAAQPTLSLDTGTPAQVYVTADNQEVFVALGSGGVDAFPFDANSGTMGTRFHLAALHAKNSADNALTSDSASKYLFVGEAGSGIRVLTIGPGGTLQEISGSPFSSTQTAPSSLVVDPGSSHLFVADTASNKITGYAIGGGGALTAVSSTPFRASASPTTLSLDASEKNMLSVSGGTPPDLQIFSFDPSVAGKLDSGSTVSVTAATSQPALNSGAQ